MSRVSAAWSCNPKSNLVEIHFKIMCQFQQASHSSNWKMCTQKAIDLDNPHLTYTQIVLPRHSSQHGSHFQYTRFLGVLSYLWSMCLKTFGMLVLEVLSRSFIYSFVGQPIVSHSVFHVAIQFKYVSKHCSFNMCRNHAKTLASMSVTTQELKGERNRNS